jgi:ArsR family transcriptional regulator, arsenate/arsenite/antimonite-responsive transcriptional repressor
MIDPLRAFRALSDPTRLGIVSLLRQRPLCVWELQGHLGRDQAVVSKHLHFLRSAGIVSVTTEGNLRRYSLVTGNAFVDRLWACVDSAEQDPE